MAKPHGKKPTSVPVLNGQRLWPVPALSNLWLTYCYSYHPSSASNSRPVNTQLCFGTVGIQGTDGSEDRSANTGRWTLHDLCFLAAGRLRSQGTEHCGHSAAQGIFWVFLNGIVAWLLVPCFALTYLTLEKRYFEIQISIISACFF